MAVTLTFSDDDHKAAINALNADSWINTIWELDQWLRSECKYNDKRDEKEIDALYECRDKIREILTENGVNINEVL